MEEKDNLGDNNNSIFEKLLEILKYKLNHMYQKSILSSLSINEYLDLRELFQKLGYTMHYQPYHISQVKALQDIAVSLKEIEDWKLKRHYYDVYLPNKYLTNYKQIKSINISDYYYQLYHQMEVNIIHFTKCYFIPDKKI